MKISFSPPYIDSDVIESVLESLNSGWITTGPKVKALEELMAEYVGTKYALCVNSWTSGALLACNWFDLKKDDEVIIPAYTYAATALAVLHAGAKPVMIDVGEDFMMNPDLLYSRIHAKTKIIMPVDFGGGLADYYSINKVAESTADQFVPDGVRQEKLNRIMVLADAAHSIGAKQGDVYSGKLCDLSVFSYHAVKNVTTAEGGAITLNLPASFDDAEEYKWLKLMSLNGQTKDAFTKAQAGGWKYDIVMKGLKINMPDIAAAIGLVQLRKYESLHKERKRVFDAYIEQLKIHDWAILPEIKKDTRPSYHLFPLRIRNITEEKRDKIISILAEKGISVNVHFNPLPNLTYFKKLGYDISDYPMAQKLYRSEISLPIYPQLKNVEVEYLVSELQKAYQKVI